MDMGHGGMDHGGDTGCKISMLWNWNTVDACFLTSSWHIPSEGAFAATCIGVMLMVVILEFLRRAGKEYDALILRQFKRHVEAQRLGAAGKKDSPRCSASREPEPEEATPARPQVITFRASPLQQLVRSVIHAVTFGLAYIVMLLAMYFNGYIIISIIIGAGIGKFLCDWMVHRIVIDVDQAPAPKVDGIEDATVCCG
ncbi:Ctr copper transporter family-domain-containing protein [Apiospora marii]|uniref:Copper transport protein n=1 Tax=Apiospora marii TaxID=335849 RepID=A0ABR1R409_9PEZI